MPDTPMNRRPIRAKINDVAELAGVSTKTVSRVLNNEPNVRTETREKVRKAVAELNYVPDFSARSLAGQRSYMIALFYDTVTEGYLNKFQAGALAKCRDHNYHLLVERCDNDDPVAASLVADAAAQTRIDGVILIPPLSDNPAVLSALAEAGVPHVLIAPSDPRIDLPSVDMDDERAAFELVCTLVDLGHRRIGHIKGHPAHGVSALRYQGYARALKAGGLEVDADILGEGLFSIESGRLAALDMLAKPDRPTAIFAANDEMAVGTRIAAETLGLAVPEDVSIVGFDDAQIAAIVTPSLTTVRQPIRQMAEGAVDLVIEAARNRLANDMEVPKRQYRFDIVRRASTAPPPDGFTNERGSQK